MGIGGWIIQNWFDLLSATGIIGSLCFTAVSFRSEAKTRRVANLLALTQNHRELWKDFYRSPQLARVLDISADLASSPLTLAEGEFVNLVIQHLASVYQAMRTDLTVKPANIRLDVLDFFALPIPRAVWQRVRPFQDADFVRFVEGCLAGS